MLALSVEMTLLFRQGLRSVSAGRVTVDFNVTFGARMESFVKNKNHICELMWTWQLENSDEFGGKSFL